MMEVKETVGVEVSQTDLGAGALDGAERVKLRRRFRRFGRSLRTQTPLLRRTARCNRNLRVVAKS